MRLLGLTLGDLVPEGDVDWELYLQLHEMVDISFATVISCEYIPYLKTTVQAFLVDFAQRYGAAALTPKMHYLVHYAKLIWEL